MAANSAVIGLLRVLLSANTAEFESAMERSSKAAKSWSRDLKQIGQQATQVGSALTKAITLPIAGVGLAASKLAIDFESSFAGVRKTVDGTEPQLAELAQGFRNLSKTIPVNVNDLNRLGEAAGALGVPRDKIVEFAAVMAKLGVSTNLTADQAADAIARIQNIFGAAGQNTEQLASTLVALGNAGASTEKEIVEMGQRIAGAGHTVGLTQAQVLAFASTLASVGINAEAGGSAISRVFLKINDAVQKGGKGLDEFARVSGMTSAQFKTAFETNAAGAMQTFIEGLGRLKSQGENINATIEGLTGKNIILKDTLFRLAGAGQLLGDQLKIADDAWRSNTALTKEASERFKTTESRMLLLGNRVKDVGITLGNALRPTIDVVIRGFDRLIPVLEKIVNGFAALPPSMQASIIGLAGVVAAAGPAVYILGQLALSGSAIATAFGANGFAMKALVGFRGAIMAIGTAAGGVALPLTALAATIVGVRLATGNWWETLKVVAVPLYGLVDLVNKLVGGLIPAEGVLHDVARIVQDALVIGFRELSRQLGIFMDYVRLIPSLVSAAAAALTDELAAAVTRIIDLVGKVLPNSMKLALLAIASMPGVLSSTKKAIHDAADAMDRLVNPMPESTKAWFGLSNMLTGQFTPALQGVIGPTTAAAAATRAHTAATTANTEAGTSNIKMLSEKAQVLDLLAKAHAHEAAALQLETSYWDKWQQSVSAFLSKLPKGQLTASGILGMDPSKLYTPKSPFEMDPRNDTLGPIGLDPSKIDMGAWAKGIPDSQRQSFWSNMFGSPAMVGQQLAGTIVGAFQGGGSAVKSGISQLGSSVAGHFGESLTKAGGPLFNSALGSVFAGALPVVGSLIGPLASALWGHFFGTKGRDAVKDFAKSLTGVDDLNALNDFFQKNLPADQADRFWKLLTQGTGRNNPEQAAANIKLVTEALAAQKKKQEEVADAAKKSAEEQQAAIDGITEKYKTQIDEIDSRYKTLSSSVAKEAEEEHMGITETLEREEMKRLETQKKSLEEQRDAEIDAKKESFDKAFEEAELLDKKLRELFGKGYKVPLDFELPGKPYIPPSALDSSYGSSTMDSWSQHAAATAMPGGAGTVQVILNGSMLAEEVVPHIPGVVKRLGLNR